jgi:hypothetical protein
MAALRSSLVSQVLHRGDEMTEGWLALVGRFKIRNKEFGLIDFGIIGRSVLPKALFEAKSSNVANAKC